MGHHVVGVELSWAVARTCCVGLLRVVGSEELILALLLCRQFEDGGVVRPHVLTPALEPFFPTLYDEQVVGLDVNMEIQVRPRVVDRSFPVLSSPDVSRFDVGLGIKYGELDAIVVPCPIDLLRLVGRLVRHGAELVLVDRESTRR